MAMNLQIAQLVLWIGVIMVIPIFSRFCYSASALLWRRLFPTRVFEFNFKDESTGVYRTLTVKLPRGKSKTLVSLIDEALAENSKDK